MVRGQNAGIQNVNEHNTSQNCKGGQNAGHFIVLSQLTGIHQLISCTASLVYR